MNNKLIALGAFVFIALVTFASSAYVISEREQALVVRFGDPKLTIREPGLYFRIPFADTVIRFEKRILSLEVLPQIVLTSDQKRILVDSFARFRIADPLRTYQAGRNEFGATSLLQSVMQSTVRLALAKQPLSAIVSGERAGLMRQISELTNERALSLGLEVIDVRLKRVDLPSENSQAVFRRMQAERKREANEARAEGEGTALRIRSEAERAVAVVTAEAERKSQIIRGEADATAAHVFANAYGKDPEFFEFYRTLQAYRKTLGKDETSLVLSPNSDFLHLFKNGRIAPQGRN